MKIKTVTITGADNSVKPSDLECLTSKYPCVEWGILLSQSSQGRIRFPSWDWIEDLGRLNLNLSGHLCGGWVRDIVNNNTLSFKINKREFWDIFGRFQFNFHAEHFPNCSLHGFQNFMGELSKVKNKQFIFQMDGVNEDFFWMARHKKVNAVPLFDLSHGAGVLPEKWLSPINGVFTGFAGGLSPDNLAEQLEKIAEVAENATIWIDAETQVRSNNDTQFDLEKVDRFLEIAKQYVIMENL